MRVLRNHGLPATSLTDVIRATIIVKLTYYYYGKLNIANVYVPPTADIDPVNYSSLFSLPNTIIVGDWNAKK